MAAEGADGVVGWTDGAVDSEEAVESATAGADGVGESQGEAAAVQQPELLLYSSTLCVEDQRQRPVLAIYDATNDPSKLSSRRVKRCFWIRNVPEALRGVVHSPNSAVCALRDALNPGRIKGSSGVNAKEALCVNETGVAIHLQTVIKNGTLADLITAGVPLAVP